MTAHQTAAREALLSLEHISLSFGGVYAPSRISALMSIKAKSVR